MRRQDIFVIGAFGASNFGDDWLEGLLKSVFSNLNLSFLSHQTKLSHIYKWNLFKVFFTIMRSQCIIVGPGSLFQAISSKKQNFYYISLILFAKLCRKKIAVVGVGIEPMPYWITHCVLFCFRGISSIYVRDAYTFRLLQMHNIKSYQFTDLVFLKTLKISKKKMSKQDIKRVGLCVSSYNFSQRNKMFQDLYMNRDRVKLSWVGYASLGDKLVADQFAKQFKVECILICYPNWLDRPIDIDVLISMRYHLCLWAYLANIPFVSLGNQEKLRDFARFCNMSHLDIWEEGICNQLFELCYDEKRSNVLKKNRDILIQYFNKGVFNDRGFI